MLANVGMAAHAVTGRINPASMQAESSTYLTVNDKFGHVALIGTNLCSICYFCYLKHVSMPDGRYGVVEVNGLRARVGFI